MSTSDNTEAAFFDPEYSVLVLASNRGRNGAQYLDVTTGWRAPSPGPAIRVGQPRRAMLVEMGGDVETVGGR